MNKFANVNRFVFALFFMMFSGLRLRQVALIQLLMLLRT